MVHVVEFRPERSQYAYTFGGVAPVARVKPGSVLKLWSEDAFNFALQSVDDLSSAKVDLRAMLADQPAAGSTETIFHPKYRLPLTLAFLIAFFNQFSDHIHKNKLLQKQFSKQQKQKEL